MPPKLRTLGLSIFAAFALPHAAMACQVTPNGVVVLDTYANPLQITYCSGGTDQIPGSGIIDYAGYRQSNGRIWLPDAGGTFDSFDLRTGPANPCAPRYAGRPNPPGTNGGGRGLGIDC